MTIRTRLSLFGVLLGTQFVFAQVPAPPRAPVVPGAPQPLPPSVTQTPATNPAMPQPDPSVKLPLPESLRKIDYPTVNVRRLNESWQLWAGTTLMRDFGKDQAAAEEALRTIRELRPTEWGLIGSTRPVVEYGLTNGEPSTWAPTPRWSLPLDLTTVRAENVRGAWVVRDDSNILLNFGPSRLDAEQAAAVAKKYGFNRVGLIGFPNPTMAYFYAAPVLVQQNKGPDPTAALAVAAQERQLTRTGIPVPGVGFVGERIVLDPRKVEVRKDRGEFVLAHGPDILGRFGQSEWSARDALKVVQDCRFTEFCTLGEGVSFFLVNGAAPTRVPFSVQGTRFDPKGLKARPLDGRWGVFEASGRMLFPAATESEANQLIRVIQAYQFDQLCQVGLSSRASLRFLARTGR